MVEFIRETFCNASVFWGAVEALATLGAFIFLLVELPKMRREKASYTVEGLKFAFDQLSTAEYQVWEKVLIDSWKKGNENYSEMVEIQIVSILTKMDFISKLIDIGYIDRELFLYSFSEDLWSFAEAIKYYGDLENYNLHSTLERCAGGFELLIDASKYFFEKYGSRH